MTLDGVGADIYIKKGHKSDPNEFDYDMSFKNIKNINLASDDLMLLKDTDGYSVAIYVYGIDGNTLLESSLKVKFTQGKGKNINKAKKNQAVSSKK